MSDGSKIYEFWFLSDGEDCLGVDQYGDIALVACAAENALNFATKRSAELCIALLLASGAVSACADRFEAVAHMRS